MKFTMKLLCLLLALLFLLPGCAQSEVPSDTGTASDSLNSDADTPADTSADTAPEEDPAAPFDPAADPYRGTVVNIDGDAIYYMSNYFKGDVSNLEDKCEQWFNRLYKDAGVSDLLYNINFVVPTESWMEYQDFYVRSLTTGEKLHETTQKLGKLYNTVYNEMKIDPYSIWIDLCYENGINPWLSFRMNDVHFPNGGYGDDDFFILAKEKGWYLGKENGHGTSYQWCLDYTVPEVQNHHTEYIDELLARYDVYGIELDWMRNIHCFRQDSKENCKYMNEFIQKINKIVEKYEKQYGHEIKIMVRLSRDLDQNEYFGFDLRTWAKNGWFDVAVPTARRPATDSDMPIDVWKAELAPYGIEVYAGLEHTVVDTTYQNQNTLAAYTSMYLQRGADKMYLYNLFNSGAKYYKICASLKDAHAAVKRSYVVAHQDTAPVAAGIEAYKPLPVIVNASGETDPIVMRHGRMNERWDTYIYVGVTNKVIGLVEKANLRVTYNGVECEYKGSAYNAFIGNNEAYRCVVSFKIPKEAWTASEVGEIVFSADSSLRIGYVELMNGLPLN